MGLNILLTSMGGLVSPGIIEDLRSSCEIAKIVAVDNNPEAIGRHFADRFFTVPLGDDPSYIQHLINLCQKEEIDVVAPFSDEETLAISSKKKDFSEQNIATVCSLFEDVSVAGDKGSMLLRLKERGLVVPRFSLPRTTDDLFSAAQELGYPEKEIIVKPRRGRGGRGVVLLKETPNVMNNRGPLELKLEWYAEEAKKTEPLDIILMEYLPGEDYSVDCLCINGNPEIIVPRRRMNTIAGPSLVGKIVKNGEVETVVRSTLEQAFSFDSNVNVQLRYSQSGEGGVPLVYEINPRLAGTIVANKKAGADLLLYGILHAAGIALPAINYLKEVNMSRYFKEYYW
ncbi:MAG: ATP-grasp domain-containing protein [Desulfobulbaceae bacterium]|nr:ATP-grasp domain-containing protein [Desulfobulbaceae bacterium]